MSLHARVLLAAAVPALLACASQSQSTSALRPSSSTTLTREELREVDARNAYDAVQQLRPRWLMVRSVRSFSRETEIVVFQDRMFLGNEDALERIGLDGVYWIEYVDGPTAQATLPGLKDRHIQGAIVVHMSPPEGRD
jgi:hypothetical protein